MCLIKRITGAALIIGILGGSAHAATVYDQDGTRLDVYGRIAMSIAGGGPVEDDKKNSAEFRNLGSRLGIRAEHNITSDLSAFAGIQWRFNADELSQPGFTEVRHSYIGLASPRWGQVQVGSFDSPYKKRIMVPFDVYRDKGYEFSGSGTQARGDSIAYLTPEIEGFSGFLMAKHFSERGNRLADQSERGSVIATQGGAVYEAAPLRLALGYVEDTLRGGGNGKNIYGATASANLTDMLSGRLGYEYRGDHGVYGGGFKRAGVGASADLGDWELHLDYYHIRPEHSDNSRNAWAAGTHYQLSPQLDFFAELNNADMKSIRSLSDANDNQGHRENLKEDLYYAIGARYNF
ncbi:porin [Vreelandella olivaria]|uniref:porin n=1 Tax=Vreelandella olivaria TaxID=390919 RepID=UPI00201E8675|nr:porin [Halomonas olivaria]